MTRKDYVMIARALHTARTNARLEDRAAIGDAAEEIAVALQKDNPRFDMEKYWRAVNLGQGI